MPRLSKRSLLVLVTLALVLIMGGVLVYYVYVSPTGMKAMREAPLSALSGDAPVSYTTIDGGEFSFDSARGSVLVVSVWASWSPYTRDELTALGALSAEGYPNTRFLAVNRMEDRGTAIAYLTEVGRVPGIEYILDGGDDLYKLIGGFAMPETVVFDSVGNIAYHRRGTMDIEELRTILKTLTEGT